MRKIILSAMVLSSFALAACSEKTEQAASDTVDSAREDIATRAAPVASEAAADVGDAVGNAATDAAGAINSAARDVDARLSRDRANPAPTTAPTGTPSPQ